MTDEVRKKIPGARVGVWHALRRDAHRYSKLGGWFRSTGFWLGATYRFGGWARAVRPAPLRILFLALHRVLELPGTVLLNVTIRAESIGPGLCLIHPRNVLIGGGTILGADCLVFHEVTFGTNALSGEKPKVGDRVEVYVGARILGKVEIGNDAVVGANVVVTRDVPAGFVILAAKTIVAPRALVGLAPSTASGAEQSPESEARRGISDEPK